MNASLRALLGGIIDYAGLFPPAALSLEESIRNYARYRTEPESWMLGKFICPADQLAALSGQLARFAGAPALRLSVLIGGGDTLAEFEANLERHRKQVRDFEIRHFRHEAAIDTYELRVPAVGRLVVSNGVIVALDQDAGMDMQAIRQFGREWFWELPAQGDIHLATLEGPMALERQALLRAGNQQLTLDQDDGIPGFKLRCGGTTAAAFPTVERVAKIIAACCLLQTRLKFTAGLHHPLRRFDSGLQVTMHGFVNVFVAAVLTHAHRLDEPALRSILEDDDPASFRFDDEALHWRDRSATVAEITAARRLVTSFGSCSFDEPRDDLRQLGWL